MKLKKAFGKKKKVNGNNLSHLDGDTQALSLFYFSRFMSVYVTKRVNGK